MMMKTVKDFKAKGGVVVALDVIGHDTERHGTRRHVEIHDAEYHNKVVSYDDYSLKSFAWRTTAGVKPEFYGVVELMEVGGHTGLKHSSCVNWAVTPQGGDANIKKWRPHLPKVESLQDTSDSIDKNFDATMDNGVIKAKPKSPYDVDAHVSGQARCEQVFMETDFAPSSDEPKINMKDIKPIYTKAMADAGELPPVGSEFKFTEKKYSDRIDQFLSKTLKVIGLCKNGDRDIIVWGHSSLGVCCGYAEGLEPEPIQTEREKAIEDVTGEWPMADVSTIEVMYDMGYRKC